VSVFTERFPDDAVDLTISSADRTPLRLTEDRDGVRFIGIAGPDGGMLPMKGVRSEKAYRPLALDDRLVCWHPESDFYEIVRVGAMTYDDLISAAYNAEYRCHPSLLQQSLMWLWWRISGDLMDDRTATVESLTDAEGNSPLDFHWDTAV